MKVKAASEASKLRGSGVHKRPVCVLESKQGVERESVLELWCG